MRGFDRKVGSRSSIAFFAALWIVIAAGGFAGCRRRPSETPPKPVAVKAPMPVKLAPPTPIQVKRVDVGDGPTWNPEWDAIIERSLPAAFLGSRAPRDVRRFCPRFDRMSRVDKREFWAYFFQALAAAEAGLNPRTNVRHTEPQVAVRDRVTGQLVHSEGLLQLAYEDAKRYGCNFDWRADRNLPAHDPERTILNPVNNLECGIRILYRQVIVQHRSLVSSASYWSTLHPGTPDYAVFAKQMTDTPSACRLPSKNPAAHGGISLAANDRLSTIASPKAVMNVSQTPGSGTPSGR
jgi:hypothetical protein